MKYLYLTTVIITVCFVATAQTITSELVSSAGNSFITTNYNLDCSLGELSTQTLIGSLNIITQGLHQGNYNITSIKEHPLLKLNIAAYPNPTHNFITLYCNTFQNLEDLKYYVTDITGKTLYTDKITSINTNLNFETYNTGAYFVRITQNNHLIKTFKIIKTF